MTTYFTKLHCTYERVLSQVCVSDEQADLRAAGGPQSSSHTDQSVVSHVWMSYVTHMNESCCTYEWVMSHEWVSDEQADLRAALPYGSKRRVTCADELCHTYAWVMLHIRMSHVAHMTESCHKYEQVDLRAACLTCEYVRSHVRISQVTHMNESPVYIRHGTRINESWNTIKVTPMKESCHTYEQADLRPAWLCSSKSDVTRVNDSCHTYEWVMPHFRISRGVHLKESRHTYEQADLRIAWPCDSKSLMQLSENSLGLWYELYHMHTWLSYLYMTLLHIISHAYMTIYEWKSHITCIHDFPIHIRLSYISYHMHKWLYMNGKIISHAYMTFLFIYDSPTYF